MPSDSKKLVPKLRFPEFTDEWRAKKLGNVSVSYDQKRIPIESADRQKMQGAYPYYGASGIIDYIDEYIFDGEYILLAEDGANILMRSSPVAFLAEGKFWVNNHAHVLRAKGSNGFLVAYLENLRYEKYNTGTAQPKLNAEICKNIEIVLPDEKEQQKIADFLTVVDKKIESIDKKIELLKQYKKVVMQKIFTQQLRFKDENGNNYPGWSTKKVADIYSFIRTNSASREVLWSGDGIKNIHYGDIHTNIPSRLDVTKYDLPAFKDGHITFAEQDYCQSRDVLMADASEDYKDIGKCIEIIRVGEQKVVGGLHVLLLRPSVEIAVGFGGYLFKSDLVRKQIQRVATGVSVLGISKANVAEIEILIPTYEEQRKISDYLGSLDDHISVDLKRLENLRQFKSALLQRMFA